MVYQLVYSSRTQFGIDERTMEKIALTAQENNMARGITGMLLFSGGHILQVIEGDYEDVQSRYMAIARDPRHAEVTVLAQRETEARAFGNQPMGYKSIQSSEGRAAMTALTTALQTAAYAFPKDNQAYAANY